MTTRRAVVVLLSTLMVLMSVVMLRTETVRLHYELSLEDREALALWEALREGQLELARLRNPMVIRHRVADALLRIDSFEKAWTARGTATDRR